MEYEFSILTEDFLEGNFPELEEVCLECDEGYAIPADINNQGEFDKLLGLDPSAVSFAHFFDNSWVREENKEQHFRESFLLRVLHQLAEDRSAEELAELYAFFLSEGYQFLNYDVMASMESDPVSLSLRGISPSKIVDFFSAEYMNEPFWEFDEGNTLTLGTNFNFWGKSVHYISATHVSFEYQSSEYSAIKMEEWTIRGTYDVKKAADDFWVNYKEAKRRSELWKDFIAAMELALAGASIFPLIRGFSLAAKTPGAIWRTGKYVLYALDTLFVADTISRGTTRLIGGEEISLGKELFGAIGEYVDPKDGKERGEQLFMIINLLMLAPLATGTIVWSATKIPLPSGKPLLYKHAKDIISGARKVASMGQVIAPYVELRRMLARRLYKVRSVPSLDNNTWHHAISLDGAKANAIIKSKSVQEDLAMKLYNAGGNIKDVENGLKLIGDAGEEIFRRQLVSKFGFPEKNIIGSLENSSGQGLDLIVKVPPPESLSIRRIVGEEGYKERNTKIGYQRKGSRNGKPYEAYEHKIDEFNLRQSSTGRSYADSERIIVFEIKTTLGQKATPGLNEYQLGGIENISRVLDDIKTGRFSKKSMKARDPNYLDIVDELEEAMLNGKVITIHGQVFMKPDASLDTLVGNGTGIQMNSIELTF